MIAVAAARLLSKRESSIEEAMMTCDGNEGGDKVTREVGRCVQIRGEVKL